MFALLIDFISIQDKQCLSTNVELMHKCHQQVDEHDDVERLVIDDDEDTEVPRKEGKRIQNALSDNNNDFESNEEDFKKEQKFHNGDHSLQ